MQNQTVSNTFLSEILEYLKDADSENERPVDDDSGPDAPSMQLKMESLKAELERWSPKIQEEDERLERLMESSTYLKHQ